MNETINEKVYIHEYIDIIGHNRANYMHHMTANFSPIAQEERNQLCYGVWGTVGTTRRWPEVVNLWEEDGFDGHGHARSATSSTTRRSRTRPSPLVGQAAQFRRSGDDRVIIPAPWTRTIEQLCADGVRGESLRPRDGHRSSPAPAWDYVEPRARPKPIAALRPVRLGPRRCLRHRDEARLRSAPAVGHPDLGAVGRVREGAHAPTPACSPGGHDAAASRHRLATGSSSSTPRSAPSAPGASRRSPTATPSNFPSRVTAPDPRRRSTSA